MQGAIAESTNSRRFTTARMQEVGRKPLLRFLHSPHPCGLATQEQLPRSGSFAGPQAGLARVLFHKVFQLRFCRKWLCV